MPCKLKICHNYNKNERLCICKWWLYDYCIQKRMLGPYLQKAIVSALKKKKGGNYFSGTYSFWIGRTVLLLKTVRWKSNGALDCLCSVLRTGSHCSEPTLFSGGYPGVSGGCQINLGMDSQQLRKNRKPGVLFHRGKVVQEKKTSSIPPPLLHFCLRRSPCYVFLFSFSFQNRKQQPFLWKWLTHWHPLLPAAGGTDSSDLSLLSLTTFVLWEHTQVCVSVCLCVHVIINHILQTEYQSFEPFEP